jgi:hypothetical protein
MGVMGVIGRPAVMLWRYGDSAVVVEWCLGGGFLDIREFGYVGDEKRRRKMGEAIRRRRKWGKKGEG